MQDVTIAVVSFGTRDLLRACLASLVGESRADVWVVDTGSQDGSVPMVRGEFPTVQVVASSENLGFGRAVNLVAAQTSTPYLACANADVALTPGALDALLEALRADPGAGAAAPRLVLPDGSTQHSVLPFPGVRFAAAFACGRGGPLVPGRWDPEVPRRVPWAIGAFLLLRRAAWDAAGGFDPRQWMYAEDLDLGWRLRAAGWPTRYVPSAVVHHAESAATAAAWGEARRERWQRATYAWQRRRQGVLATRATAAINVAGALGRRERGWAALHWRTGVVGPLREDPPPGLRGDRPRR